MALDRALEAPLGDLPCDPPQAREILSRCAASSGSGWTIRAISKSLSMETLHSCVRSMEQQFSIGFVRFHVPWLEEWYAANRQYRQAYELVRKFS